MSSAPQVDELADRLDRALPAHGPAPAPAARGDDPLVELALRLARAPHPRLDEGRVAQMRAQVLAHAGQISWPRPASRRRSATLALRWAAAACLILVLLAVGSARVSANSLPGDTLYPVKRLVERGRLAFASDTRAVWLRLDFADRRLDEFETLLERGEVHASTLDDAVDEMRFGLALIEDGAGARDEALARLVSLSKRHLELVAQASGQAAATDDEIKRLNETAHRAEEVGAHARDLAGPGISAPDDAAPTATPKPTLELESVIPRDLSAESSVLIPADATQDAPSAPTPGMGPDVGSTVVFIVPMADTPASPTQAVEPLQPPAAPVQFDPRAALGTPNTLSPTPVSLDPTATSAGPVEPSVTPGAPPIQPVTTEPPPADIPPADVLPIENTPINPPITEPPVVEMPLPTGTSADRTPSGDPATPTVTPVPTETPTEVPDTPTVPPVTPDTPPATESVETPGPVPGEPPVEVVPTPEDSPGLPTVEPLPPDPVLSVPVDSAPPTPAGEANAGPTPVELPTETPAAAPELPLVE